VLLFCVTFKFEVAMAFTIGFVISRSVPHVANKNYLIEFTALIYRIYLFEDILRQQMGNLAPFF